MNCSRLRLDFSLDTADERTKFLHDYLAQEIFQKRPLNADEIEMCGNYLL